jgi:alpha-ketoglutarate-dependent taurine dioxygenase
MVRLSLPLFFTGAATTAAFVPAPQPRVMQTSMNAAAIETPPSPLTAWGETISDIKKAQAEFKKEKLPEFAPEISSADLGIASDDKEAQLKYFEENALEIKKKMEVHGAVIFRNFDLMKEQEGFQKFYNAIGMKVCQDPLQSVSARPTADGKKDSPVYEAVNKESRKNFFIGMHNEFVGTRAPRAAAFVCFKAAETGGEFIIADGRRMFRDLDPDVVEELYNRNIRYSVMELPFFGWIDNVPEPLQEPVKSGVKGLVSAAINAKVDFSVEMLWGESGYDNTRMLQARAPSQPPIVLHPVTGEPTWFCNVHSHSSKLRKERESLYGAERFEDGASQINKSDMFYGDDGDITEKALKNMDEITYKNARYVKMTEGDVVLLDNYKCMHGRNVFDGTRKHAVAWFGGFEGEEEVKELVAEEMKKLGSDFRMPFFGN